MADSKVKPYTETFPKISVDNLLELFRELRQTTTSKCEQDANSKELLPTLQLLANIVDYLSSGVNDNVIDKFVLSVCARVGVQFLGNAIVENEENQNLLWSQSNLLRKIFFYKDTKLKNYTSMVYLNIMLQRSSTREELLSDDEFINELIDEAMLGLTEFPQFIVEKFLEFNNFDRIYSEKRKTIHRIYILDMVLSLLNKEGFTLDAKSVDRISSDFKNKTEVILNGAGRDTMGSSSNCGEKQNGALQNGETTAETVMMECKDDPRLTVKLLSTLCSLSIDDNYSKSICDNASLVIDAIYVLRALKMADDLRKESGSGTTESNQPIIGFKADLIRLLSNLCYRHKKNQDLVRENNCIELILECCKMDENNPFVCEWAVMAIRNLCENNPDNATYIGSLKRNAESDLVTLAENVTINSE